MASTVTRLRKARRIVNVLPAFMRFLKRSAHRWVRRSARQRIRNGQHDDVFERPRLTGWDIV